MLVQTVKCQLNPDRTTINPKPEQPEIMKTRKLLTLTSAIAAVLLVGGIVNASADWRGTHSLSWNDPLNWDGSSVPDGVGAGIFMVGNGSTTFTATITNDVAGRPSEIVMGGFGTTARVDHRAGTLGTQNPGWPPGWMLLGFSGNGNATYNLADTTTTGGTFTGYGTGSGTLNIVDALFMGEPGGGDGNGTSTLNINTTGALNSQYDFSLGVSGWNATMNLDAGAFNVANGWIRIPNGVNNNTNTTTSGTLNQSGGSFDSHWGIRVGGDPGSTYYTNLVGTVNLNGGTMTTHGPNWWDGGVWIGCGGTGTFNLNGGTLTTPHVLHEGTTGTSIFNFNGGTLKASGSLNVPWGAFFGGDPNYLADGRSFTAAYVQAGGAIIDTAGFDNYIGQALLTGTNITDGGLTKNGNGQLEMGAANTFTGPVVVNGGRLYANKGNGPNNANFSFASSITVNSNATLRATGNSLFGWDGSQAKPITVNVGGTATAENGDQNIGLVTLAGGTLASVNPDGFWGSWHFGRASVKNLLVTSNSTASAEHVSFTAGATIEVASGMTLNFTGFIGDGGGDGATAVIKQGTGILTLSGINTYTGNTTISGGTLSVTSPGSIASGSAVTVQNTATLGGNGTINGVVTVNSGGTLAPGTTSIGTLTLGSTLSLAGTANFRLNKTGSTLTSDQVAGATGITAGGTLSVTPGGDALADGNTFTLFNSTPTGTFSTTPTLASGANWYTANNYQTLTYNVWPTAGAASFTHPKGMKVRFSVGDVLTHVSGAITGKTITLTSLGYPTVSGATMITNGPLSSSSTMILYTPGSADANDSFSYTVSDGRGGSATGTVNLVADATALVGQQSPQLTVGGDGNIQVKFYGVVGYTYIVQRATDLTGTGNWTDISTNAIGVNDSPAFTITDRPGQSAYYRLKWQP